MSRIIPKNRDPKINEFGPDDFVLNTLTGDLFVKANNKLYKLTSRDQVVNISNEDVLNNITVTDITQLKNLGAINTSSVASVATDDNVDYSLYLKPEAIFSKVDDSTYKKFTIAARVGQFVSGNLFFDQNLSGSNNYIALGKIDTADTQFRFSGNITASGNISASGNVIVGNTIQLNNTPSSDYIQYNNGFFYKGNGNFIGNITASGDISASSGNILGRRIFLDADLIHSGDEDTKMTFGSDNITFNVGTIPLLALNEDTQNLVTIGNGGDVDFQVKSGETNALFVQGSSGNTGLGLNNPGEKLTVIGNISASGTITGTTIIGTSLSTTGNITVDGNIVATGDITAKNYIVSSSITHLTQSFSSGSTIFGNTSDDTHTFTGDITASGNISSSGTIVATSLQDTSLTAGRLVSVAANGVLNDDADFTVTGNDMSLGRDLTIGRNLIIDAGTISNVLTTHVTASGNISSSGTIISSNLSGTNTGDQDLSSYSTITQLNASSSTLQTNIDAKAPIANPSFTGNVTASGNISASGTITANSLVGPLSTAAQPNITSVGTLTNLIVDNVQINSNAINSTSDTDVFITIGTAGLGFEANNGDKFEFNSAQNNVDFKYNGESDGNLLYIDASTDKVGIGVSTPGEKLTVTGNISSSGTIVGSNLSGTNTGDQDLSSYSTIVQLNASSSTLQTNIDAKAPIANPSFTSNVTASGNISASGDITGNSIIADYAGGTISVGKGGTGQTTLASDSVLTGNGTSGITAESNLTYNGTDLKLTSDGLGAPDIIIESTADHSSAGNLVFQKLRADNTPADGGGIGTISFNGEDTGLNTQVYGQIVGIQEETGEGTEGGKIKINVATHDGELQSGLIIEDGDAEDEVDVTIGNTATSVTTIAGTLTMGSTAFVNNSGVVQVATQGTIDHDSLANFVANEHIDHSGVSITAGAGLTGGGTIAATRDIAVGAGTGVTVNANDVAIGQDVATTANVLFNNITASGDISSSGNLITTTLQFTGTDTSEDALHYLEFKKPGNTVSNITNGVTINPSSDTLVLGGTTTIAGQAGTITGLTSLTSTNITASNISSSGTVIGSNLTNVENTAISTFAGTTNITTVGTIGDGTWNGNVIQDAYLSSNTAHLTGTQTFSGAKTFSANAILSGTTKLIASDMEAIHYDGQLIISQDNRKSKLRGTSFNVDTDITSSGNISSSGTITGNSIVGTLSTAAQTNITSVGTLGSLTVSGDITANGNIVGDDSTNITNISSIECDSLVHNGDTDTKLTFGTDQIRFTAGNSVATSFNSVKILNNLPLTNKFVVPGTNAGDEGGGDVVYFGGTTSMTTGAIYHYKSDGTWELADATDNTKADGLLGVALGSTSDSNGVLLRGMVTLDHDAGNVGDPIYLTTTAGDASATAPGNSGNVVRHLGYKIYHATEQQIWFNPSNDWIEIA